MMTFECRSGQWTLTREDYEYLFEAHSTKDVPSEIIKAKSWLHCNPGRRKTPRGMMRFLNSWLSNAPVKPRGFIETHTDTSWANNL